MQSILFKILHRQNKFRNPTDLVAIPSNFSYSVAEYHAAENYLDELVRRGVRWTYPGHSFYPTAFYKMKEPPLFLEFQGDPFWMTEVFISVVGSRQISTLTESWLKQHLGRFLKTLGVGVVSGGALGVDQLAHDIALKEQRLTVFVLPSGLGRLYPKSLSEYWTQMASGRLAFLSEFEYQSPLHKSYFFHRNRLIAALGEVTLVAQASLKSGSLLTVHHCLQNGRPVLTVPSHPQILGFEGNLKLARDGAYLVSSADDLLDFWKAEMWSRF